MASLRMRRRTPQGVRGLKLSQLMTDMVKSMSHSARSAWIETLRVMRLPEGDGVALRKECVD